MKKFFVRAGVTGAALCLPVLCHAQVNLPDTGVDVPGHITALVTSLGTVAAAAIGAWAAFFVVKRGIQWVKRVG